VPGVIEAGDHVSADGRIIKAATLEIDESALTGESAPVPKQIQPIARVDTPLGDRTDVTRGAGEFLVTATGMATEVGHISGLLQTTELEKTPLIPPYRARYWRYPGCCGCQSYGGRC